MPSDTPDRRRRAAEESFRATEAVGERGHLEVHRNLARAVAARETDAALEGDDRAQQSMFEDIDAILARVESGIAGERAAMDALLARLSSAA